MGYDSAVFNGDEAVAALRPPHERETKHHHQEDYRSPPHRAHSSRAGVPEYGLLWWSAWGRLACAGLVVWVPQWASTMGLVWLQ